MHISGVNHIHYFANKLVIMVSVVYTSLQWCLSCVDVLQAFHRTEMLPGFVSDLDIVIWAFARHLLA